ncbi:hypothetical protein JYB87_11980 [Shewanella avicenniae]|uniref:Phage replication protein P n=1 Tax=Shewanella avicenniae TaxID=2814294 RepID=A0ABX7QM69_9GAMM|nr:replication protein P [Shewanella avicenniae]QSX32484.1 hypothetical protein JYB87_11980 [Shewanella avicenniae]
MMNSKVVNRLMAELVPVLSVYCADFNSKFGKDEQVLKDTINEYASRLIRHGIGSKGLRWGIEHLKQRATTNKWTPNPEEFAQLCKPTAADLGVRPVDEVITEVIAKRRERRVTGRKQEYSHRIVELIDQRVGYNIYVSSEERFRELVQREYDHWVEQAIAGTLPEPRIALEDNTTRADEMNATLQRIKGFKLNENTELGARIAAIRAKARERITTQK